MRRLMVVMMMLGVIVVAGAAHAVPTVTPAAGYDMTWDGNAGDHYDEAVPDNLSLYGTPFSDGELGYGIHLTANLNDGIYGNSNSWISDADGDFFCGIDLGGHSMTN